MVTVIEKTPIETSAAVLDNNFNIQDVHLPA